MKIGPIREWKVSPALTGGAGRGKEKHFFGREAADAVLEKKSRIWMNKLTVVSQK